MAEQVEKKTILGDVKAFLGDVYDESFDQELLGHISGSIATLRQNGVGNNLDLFDKPDATWDDFFGDAVGNRGNPKQYIFYKTKIMFDAPPPATLNVMNAAVAEALWRSREEFD